MLLRQTLLIPLALLLVVSAANAQTKQGFGWVEKVVLSTGNEKTVLHAKLDTGADSSSLDASVVEEFQKDGTTWVRFRVMNRYGQAGTVEKPVRRVAIVKRHSRKHQRRKVVRLGVCLGKTYMETDFTLIDRTSFTYQMLLGRAFLAGNATVDPAITYTTEPSCDSKKKS